jgi:hypothetical protein
VDSVYDKLEGMSATPKKHEEESSERETADQSSAVLSPVKTHVVVQPSPALSPIQPQSSDGKQGSLFVPFHTHNHGSLFGENLFKQYPVLPV